ncbi:unnamed protein product [Allacma fusca]|uniref:VWFC domain-containing protein n=1 Tax=Allacma fusca TaxID=39272 RepID=A0A8J2P973_9HEXA|nr:unnamed protein product [Allacma fusca]
MRNFLPLLFFFLGSLADQNFDDCSRVRCPKIKNCPPDSYRLPTNIRPDTNDCCPMVEKCQCNPSQLCPKPECPSGWTEELIVNATGEPGNCCPLLQCSPGSLPDEKKLCLYEGTTYSPGELWTHDEDCTECKCSIDGVVTCQRIKCDMPVECGLARAPPNSCCPLCVGCVTGSGKVYNNSEVWEEDDCTLCECDEGRVKCHAAMCGTQCEHPVYIPGECCPRCKDEPAPKPAAITEGSVGRLRSQKPTCFVQDDKVGVVIKYEGDEWKDGCRFCICKSGMEMCTLITCSPPYCEHPVFFLGDCCPRCPDEEIIPRRANVNVSECPVSKSHGNFWNLSPCLRCTCHHGLTLCSHPTCPPAPCEAPRSIGSSEDNLCCSQCPPHSGEEGIDEEKIGADGLLRSSGGGGGGHVNNKNSITKSWKGKDEKRNCFSDDSHTEYSHGDTWKVSPCQSCVCEDGKIQCFSSSGNCPGLTCEQPILAKNQCCPVCLDDGEKAKTGTNCTMSGSNETWTHGHSWTLDKCTQCICNAPLVQCTRIVCSISCKEPLLYLQNECCPICPNDDDDTTPGDNSRFVFFGGPYCLVVIAVLLFTSSALAYYVLRYHRRRKRRTGDKTAEAPVTNNPTIDCCYFNKDKNYEDSRFPRSDSCATQEKLIV